MNPDLIRAMLDSMAAAARLPKVFPIFIALQVKEGLLSAESGVLEPKLDFPGATVGDIETVGDCRYRIIVTDANGTEHYVEVGVLRRTVP